jgi:hypothetical protein
MHKQNSVAQKVILFFAQRFSSARRIIRTASFSERILADDDQTLNHREQTWLLNMARNLGYVEEACSVMRYSRGSFYRFKEREPADQV